jgi:CRP-like cAMP-binding protein
MYEPLLAFFRKFMVISEDEFRQEVIPYIELLKFDKKHRIVNRGEVDNYIHIIKEGLIRKYFVRDDEEVVTQIAKEGQVIHSSISFYNQVPSEFIIETLEPTVTISISNENLEILLRKKPEMERFGRMIMTYFYLQRENAELTRLKLPPRERFLRFIEDNPDLLQRVPQKILASYLEIQPETFSRMKHLLMKGGK